MKGQTHGMAHQGTPTATNQQQMRGTHLYFYVRVQANTISDTRQLQQKCELEYNLFPDSVANVNCRPGQTASMYVCTWSTASTWAGRPSFWNSRLGYSGSRHAPVPVGDTLGSTAFWQETPTPRQSWRKRRDPVKPKASPWCVTRTNVGWCEREEEEEEEENEQSRRKGERV